MIKKLDELVQDDKNANAGTPLGGRLLARSLRELGAGRSLLLDKNDRIIAGNKTQEQALAEGFKDVIIVETDGTQLVAVKRTDLESGEAKAIELAIADNRTGELNLNWDRENIVKHLDNDIDFAKLGFSQKELEAIIGGEGRKHRESTDAKIDELERLGKKWKTEPGQLWLIGKHRMFIGDSYAEETQAALFEKKPDVVHADPPYGIDIVGKDNRSVGSGGDKYLPVIGDDKPFDPTPWLELAPVTALWGANHYSQLLPASDSWFVWDKDTPKSGELDFADCELCWSNQGGPARLFKHKWTGYNRASEKAEGRLHPNQKPVAVIAWLLGKIKGRRVFEPFAGSGSTLLACEELNKICYTSELDPRYGAYILERAYVRGLEVRLGEAHKA